MVWPHRATIRYIWLFAYKKFVKLHWRLYCRSIHCKWSINAARYSNTMFRSYTLQCWRRRQHVCPKCRCLPTKLHGITAYKITISAVSDQGLSSSCCRFPSLWFLCDLHSTLTICLSIRMFHSNLMHCYLMSLWHGQPLCQNTCTTSLRRFQVCTWIMLVFHLVINNW
jgi:hypothetical protein